MNSDFTDLLREGVDRLTAGASAPAGLADRAQRHYRARQFRVRATVTGSVAIIAVAAVLAATLGAASSPPRNNGPAQAYTAVYVTSRAERALAASEQGNLIEQLRADARHAVSFGFWAAATHPTKKKPVVLMTSNRARFWYYKGRFRQQGLTASGALRWDDAGRTRTSPAARPRRRVEDVRNAGVDYQSRSWWRESDRFGVRQVRFPRSCGKDEILLPWATGGNWAAALRHELRCGSYRIARRQHVDGVAAIELVQTRQDSPAEPFRETFWINPVTYLPVRIELSWPAKLTDRKAQRIIVDLGWLKATPANLRLLRIAIPAGFTKVAPTQDQFPLGLVTTLEPIFGR